MRVPSQQTYNDLNGAEAVEILCDWFRQLLLTQPQFQPHLTLPHAKITLGVDVAVDMYIGGTVPFAATPERLDVTGSFTLTNEVQNPHTISHNAQPTEQQAPLQVQQTRLSTVINAAPIPGGQPPDQIRAQHDLPIPSPGYGPRETGSHMFIADLAVPSVPYHPAQNPASPQPEARHPNLVVPAREGIVADGYIFSTEPLPVTVNEQVIPLQSGEIAIDLTGRGTMKQGDMVITAGTHISSAKTLGDQAGHKYGSVTGTYDAGPAGLGRAGHGGGLYSDGRPRLSFGNDRK